MSIIKVVTNIFCCFLFFSTFGQNKKQMNKIINEVANQVTSYSERPVYGIQVNKSGCKMIIEIENGLEYRFTENSGESMMLPLNVMLLNSGSKNAIIKIYPREGDSLITKEAYVNLKFTLAPDKDSGLDEYNEIASFSLPENIGTLELPYFEAKIPLEVEVPFNYEIELNKAKDLKTLPSIENKVVKKYNELRNVCKELKEVNYLQECIHSSILVFNTLYDTTKEDIKKGFETTPALIDSELYNRDFLPIENYEIQYYAKNKIVALWQKNLNPILYIKANYKYSDGDEAFFQGGDPIFLYWPEGSNELKVW